MKKIVIPAILILTIVGSFVLMHMNQPIESKSQLPIPKIIKKEVIMPTAPKEETPVPEEQVEAPATNTQRDATPTPVPASAAPTPPDETPAKVVEPNGTVRVTMKRIN